MFRLNPLPHNEYFETKRIIAKYPSLKAEYESIIHKSPSADGMPHGSGISDTTAQTAMKSIKVAIKVQAIERSLLRLPEGYQKGIIDHIVYKKPFPPYAGIATWRRWQYRFVFWVWQELEQRRMYLL